MDHKQFLNFAIEIVSDGLKTANNQFILHCPQTRDKDFLQISLFLRFFIFTNLLT